MDFLHYNFCPLPFILSLATNENGLAQFSSLSPIMCLNTSRLNSPSYLSLFFYTRCSEALTTFIALHWTCSSMSMSSHNREPRTRPSMAALAHQGWAEGKIFSLCRAAFQQVCLSPRWYLELFFWRGRTLHFLLLNFMRFLSAPSSSLSKSLWTEV